MIPMKQNDRLPALPFTIARDDGSALGFVAGDVSSVKVLARKQRTSTTLLIDAAVTSWSINEAGTELTGTYEWAAADTATALTANLEIRVTLADGRQVTFPNDQHETLQVIPRV